MFTALLVEKGENGTAAAVTELPDERLPEGEVTVAVRHSTLNYKDGLVMAGQGGLVRAWPHVPGIDLAGVVERSEDPRWRPGDAVILTGWRVGEVRWGGYATRARVRGEWLVGLPPGLTMRRAMAVGTAGLTAMLAILALERQGLPEGPVLVTGAAGGVGSVAVALLSAMPGAPHNAAGEGRGHRQPPSRPPRARWPPAAPQIRSMHKCAHTQPGPMR